MPSAKRRRIIKESAPLEGRDGVRRPLGEVSPGNDGDERDEEELELEAEVLGKDLGPRGIKGVKGKGKSRGGLIGVTVGEEEEEEFRGFEEDGELQGLEDDQLFTIDLPSIPKGQRSVLTDVDQESDREESEASSVDEGEGDIRYGDDSEEDGDEDHLEEEGDGGDTSTGPSKNLFANRTAVNASRRAVWHDPADEGVTVSLQGTSRLRKLRKEAEEDVVRGSEYVGRLRQQFQKTHPTPAWATTARTKALKRRKGVEVSDEEDVDDVEDIIRSTNAGGSKVGGVKGRLKEGTLDIQRLRDVNQASPPKGALTTIGFHPRAHVLFAGGGDRRLRLFQVDGSENPLAQSIHVPELPISKATFHPSGSSIILTGPRPFYYAYDLQAGQMTRSPRGLWNAGLGGGDSASTGGSGGMDLFKFSPDGKLVAFVGRRGYVHLLDWGSQGGGNGGQVVGELKANSGLKGLAWVDGGAGLVGLGADSEVYRWDVGMRRCVDRWRDEGGFGGCHLEVDGRERYMAVGSTSGIVNVYDAATALNPSGGDRSERKPLKSIMNLTTAVTTSKFSRDAQILAIASRTKKDSMKMVHLPSGTVFSNWPTSATPLGHVSDVDFSYGDRYAAIANQRGKVLLFSLGHYAKR